MSRSWTRNVGDGLCGRCGRQIADGDPIQVIALLGVTAKKRRGTCCADGEPPPDLPTNAERSVIPATVLTRLGDASLPLDFKQAAAGREPDEREPGCDDV